MDVLHTQKLLGLDGRFLATRQWRDYSISWFFLSIWPFKWGWYPEIRLAVVPIRVQNSLQNVDEN